MKTPYPIKLIPFLILGFISSCNDRSGNESKTISFSMDTVVVDARNEFLFLNGSLAGASISQNKELLYVFNRIEIALEIIDLNNLILKEKIQFETEGPNGIGPWISAFSIYKDDKIIFHTNNRYGLFDFEGKKIQDHHFDSVSSGLSEVEYLSRLFNWDNENMHFGIISNSVSDSYYLGHVDIQNEKVARVPLQKFKDLKDYYVTWSRNGQVSGGFGPRIQITQSPEKLILSSDYANKFYLYHPDSMDLIFKTVESSLVPNQKELPSFNIAESTEEYHSFQQTYFEDINFLPPFWDETRKVFYRFSFKEIYGDKKNQYGKAISSNSQVFLTVFDKDLNILSETRVRELNKKPGFHFAKDGQIWIFENLEDELGFVRLSIDF
ncbi:MAG: DUF4221 family protein [Cyclobacterium sp.]|nr:DUF4221 family protein [Cyclobacterium sp.]MBD3628426.1 DUF4221 family protein [Cyclobacterium sp.]